MIQNYEAEAIAMMAFSVTIAHDEDKLGKFKGLGKIQTYIA